MQKSWKLGKIAGIDIFVHWTFLLLPAWVAFSYMASGGGGAAALFGVSFLLAVFGCVLLHELGHALMARELGIATHDITMLPVGGVARLERMPEKPLHEMAVALAGPIVNVVIAATIYFGFVTTGGSSAWFTFSPVGGSFLTQLMWANIALVMFNLLPAFPMDGGRVLRASLSVILSRSMATAIASTLGQALAVLLAVVGLFSNWTLLLVAGFVFYTARQENQFVQLQESMKGAVARDAMTGSFEVIHAESLIGEVAPEVLIANQIDYPVVSGRGVVGMVSSDEILRELTQGNYRSTIGDVMRQQLPSVESHERLADCWGRFHTEGWSSAAVLDAGELVGMVTFDNLRRWLQLSPVLSRLQPSR